MADTFTEFLNLTKPEIGGSRDSWGDKGNSNADKIDTWAKATDILAKAALSRTNAADQTVASKVTYGGLQTFSAGATLPKEARLNLGNGFVISSDTRTLLAAAGDNFEVVNAANSQYILQANMAGLLYRGKLVYNEYNLDIAKFYDKTVTTRQELNGPFSVNMNTPYFDLTYGGVMRMRQVVDGNGTWILRNGDNGDNFAYVSTGGAVWTKQFGDLYNQIENRSRAFADDRLNSAKAYTDAKAANYLPLGGATSNGNYYFGGFVASNNEMYVDGTNQDPKFRLWRNNVGSRSLQLRGTGELMFTNPDGNGSHFFRQDGGFSTSQIGDLNGRIENRAAAFADDRLNSARAYTDQSFNNFRGAANVFTQDQQITKNYPSWQLHYPGVRVYSLQVRENAAFYVFDEAAGQYAFYVGPDGAIACRQFGSVNDRIEARAAAYASDAYNNANSNTANNYIPRNNGGSRYEFQTRLSVSGEWPFYELVWGGKIRWQIRIADNSELQFILPDSGAITHSFRQDGSVWSAQIGDINTRIETRAQAWVNTRNLRWVFAGDVHATWNSGSGGFGEPITHGVMTGVKADAGTYTGARWRYLQLQGTDGQWYTSTYS